MNRNKLELIYSIAVLIAIPLIVLANTFITTSVVIDKAFDVELMRKADLANSVIANTSSDLIESNSYNKLSTVLNGLEKIQPTIQGSSIIVETNDKLKVVAKSDTGDSSFDQYNALLAINEKRSVAKKIDIYDKHNNLNQAWNVMTPVLNSENEAIALISTNFLTIDAQEAIDHAYRLSFIMLAVSIIVIIILLFRHFRLVGNIQLLAKQKEVNQTMSDFLSVATHELRAPTTIIKGYLSSVIEDNNQIAPEVKKQISIALQQTERLNSLVQDLLNVSRVDQGKIEYKIAPVDTTAILNTLVENYRPIVAEKELEIIFNNSQSIPLVSADEGRVQEIFTNLIDNAYKYTSKGSITIEQKITKSTVMINFRDTGFGMGPDAKERLFQRFYRIKTEQTNNIQGTGLGLWIIKQYIEAMGGKISVETMENVGSNFIVEFKKSK